jgi:periplasmic protein TonB
MFAQSMLESTWSQKSRRSWTTLTSFAVQAATIGFLLMLPVMRTVGLPSARSLPTPIAWGPPPAIRMVAHRPITAVAQSNLSNNMLIAPREIPRAVPMIQDVVAPPDVNFNDVGGPGGPTNGSRYGVPGGIAEWTTRAVLPPAPTPSVPHAVRLSHMDPGMLIRRVQPQYPEPARIARIQGAVELAAVIGKDGTIENLHVVAGPPLLVRAAIEAVSQWRYRPYILNNEPVEVETHITVNFSLGER